MSRKTVIRHGSLFSGIGGFDLAAQWCGWDNVFHCEISEFCNTILKHYWPKAVAIKDIKAYDWRKWKNKISVLSGGFPCQPYSVAGKMRGKEDSRHLWPEMLRAIHQICPTWVVAENVRGLISWNGGMVFQEVQSDLETAGYDVLPFLLPAAGVGAPHRRERIWIIGCRKESARKWERQNANSHTDNRQQQEQPQCSATFGKTAPASWDSFGADSGSGTGNGDIAKGIRQLATSSGLLQETVANTYLCKRCQGWLYTFGPKLAERQPCTCHSRDIRETWDNFPTQSPVCNGDDGISTKLDGITFPKWRTESIKAGGNAIVPQVAFQIFKVINEFLA